MKKMMLVLAILLYTGVFHEPAAKAPTSGALVIFRSEGINPFLRVWDAVCMEESRMDSMAYNKKEKAVGIAQIRPVRLEEFNRLSDKTYTLNDLWQVNVSKEIFMFYAMRIGHNDLDMVIRKWNGSGPMTYEYLKRVKVYYNDQRYF